MKLLDTIRCWYRMWRPSGPDIVIKTNISAELTLSLPRSEDKSFFIENLGPGILTITPQGLQLKPGDFIYISSNLDAHKDVNYHLGKTN